MTKTQITAIIKTDLGYALNEIIKTPDISLISSDMDGPIYAGETTRFNFNTTDENLEIYYGRKVGNEIKFFDIPSFIVPFKNLYSIVMAGPLHQPEPYKTGQAV